jgi:hypothetical protein
MRLQLPPPGACMELATSDRSAQDDGPHTEADGPHSGQEFLNNVFKLSSPAAPSHSELGWPLAGWCGRARAPDGFPDEVISQLDMGIWRRKEYTFLSQLFFLGTTL